MTIIRPYYGFRSYADSVLFPLFDIINSKLPPWSFSLFIPTWGFSL